MLATLSSYTASNLLFIECMPRSPTHDTASMDGTTTTSSRKNFHAMGTRTPFLPRSRVSTVARCSDMSNMRGLAALVLSNDLSAIGLERLRRELVHAILGASGPAPMREDVTMRRIVDLSHVIEDGMTTYPGLPGPEIGDHLTREASRERYAPGTEFHIGRI
jgi:hypothetical protein